MLATLIRRLSMVILAAGGGLALLMTHLALLSIAAVRVTHLGIDEGARSGRFWWVSPLTRVEFDGPHEEMRLSLTAGSGSAVPIWWALLLPIAAWFMVRCAWKLRRTQTGCRHCGYDLTGNVSGECPECGGRIDPAESPQSGVKTAPAKIWPARFGIAARTAGFLAIVACICLAAMCAASVARNSRLIFFFGSPHTSIEPNWEEYQIICDAAGPICRLQAEWSGDHFLHGSVTVSQIWVFVLAVLASLALLWRIARRGMRGVLRFWE